MAKSEQLRDIIGSPRLSSREDYEKLLDAYSKAVDREDAEEKNAIQAFRAMSIDDKLNTIYNILYNQFLSKRKY